MKFNRLAVFVYLLVLFWSNICLCQSPQTITGIKIAFVNSGTYTDFTLTSTLSTINNVWIAIGLNSANQMVIIIIYFIYLYGQTARA